jgi:3-dehydroquinate synthase
MSNIVHVDLAERGYDILIGCGVPVGSTVEGLSGARALVVSDSHVDPLYGADCQAMLEGDGWSVRRLVVPAGEASKSLDSMRLVYDAAIEAGIDRRGIMVALGGGMIGDLTGFAAATFLRGIRFIQIPTTLLAMVDSSVGGKTGVNIPRGKNLVGCFHQPIEVVADLDRLRSLPPREFASGLAEVIKYGIIWDATFFKFLEEHADGIVQRDPSLLERMVARCCEIKSEVVAIDEREAGVRAILNFGHTFGHALENAAGYGAWLHGEAVAVGMVFAAEVSVRHCKFPADDAGRLRSLLARFGLPVRLEGAAREIPWGLLKSAMGTDKKNERGAPRFVLAERLGSVVFGCEVPPDELEETYGGLLCRP